MRSIFSLVASQHSLFACAAAIAASARLWAAWAADEAAWAARAALSAAALAASAEAWAFEALDEAAETWVFRSSIWACSGLRSVQPAAKTTQRAAAPTLMNLFITRLLSLKSKESLKKTMTKRTLPGGSWPDSYSA